MIAALGSAERVLAVGIGGGGDVVGALAVAQLTRLLGTPCVVGGLTWERRPIDPAPGPRRIDELSPDARRINAWTALAGPDTTGPGGFRFAESGMARHLGEPVLLLDPSGGPAAIAAGLRAPRASSGATRSCCSTSAATCSPTATRPGSRARSPTRSAWPPPRSSSPPASTTLLAVFGAGCDGELTPAEVLDRLAEVARAGGQLGTWGPGPREVAPLEAAVAEIPTEASAMALRCARGETGTTTIRAGRRTVELTTAGGLLFFLDPLVALRTAARCAALVEHAGVA